MRPTWVEDLLRASGSTSHNLFDVVITVNDHDFAIESSVQDSSSTKTSTSLTGSKNFQTTLGEVHIDSVLEHNLLAIANGDQPPNISIVMLRIGHSSWLERGVQKYYLGPLNYEFLWVLKDDSTAN